MLSKAASCRTGLLRGGRPLRGGCTGLGGVRFLGPAVGRTFLFARRRIWRGSLEPVATSVRPAAAAQMMVAAAMVTASLGWVETGGRKCVAAAGCGVGDEGGEQRAA